LRIAPAFWDQIQPVFQLPIMLLWHDWLLKDPKRSVLSFGSGSFYLSMQQLKFSLQHHDPAFFPPLLKRDNDLRNFQNRCIAINIAPEFYFQKFPPKEFHQHLD